MAYFLRVVRQSRWHKYPEINWLPNGDLQADALRDLPTSDNALSVYRIENETDRKRVIVALAANREALANLDYAIFEDNPLASIGITINQQEGQTPDVGVNKLHYDITNLTVGRLVQLAQVVSLGEHVRIPRKEIKTGLRQAVRAGTVDRDKLKPQLLKKIE